MEPTIHTGDMVVLQRLNRPPKVGEIVAIPVSDAARARFGYPPVVVHRVVRIAPDGSVTSKGDAYKHPDPFTTPVSTIKARVVARLPSGGRVLGFLSSGLGLLWLAAGAVLLIGLPMYERARDGRANEEEVPVAELRSQLEAITEELMELRIEQVRERAAQERRFEELSRSAAAQLETATAALVERLPAQIAAAVGETVATPVSAATPFWTVGPPAALAATMAPTAADEREITTPEPQRELAALEPSASVVELEPLAQLELALVPEPRLPLPADESSPQLTFAFDVESRPRFQRPCEDQLAFGLEVTEPSGQLELAPPPSQSSGAWDAPPANLVRVKRRSGGLVGNAIGAWRLATVALS